MLARHAQLEAPLPSAELQRALRRRPLALARAARIARAALAATRVRSPGNPRHSPNLYR